MLYIPGTNRINTWFLRLFMRFDYLGKNALLAPSCDIQKHAAPYIHIGENVRIAQDVWLNIPIEAKPPLKGKPVIRIGNGTIIGRRCMISGLESVTIGDNVLFGPGVFITDHSHEFKDTEIPIKDQGVTEPGKIIIEENCWLGYHCVIATQKGREIRIGRNSVVGANAVVFKSCPPNSVLVGNPARNVGLMSR